MAAHRSACLVVATIAVLAPSSCVVPSSFRCQSDAQCQDPTPGQCQATGYCGYRDPSCASGWRYFEWSDEHGSLCVEGEGVARANIVFATSTTQPSGTLGGLEGADRLCQQRATAAGLTGTYRAWLSTPAADVRARIGVARGWVRPDGRPVIDALDDLTRGPDRYRVYYPPRLDELGRDLVAPDSGWSDDFFVTTGTAADGTASGSCTFTDPSEQCMNGLLQAEAPYWTEAEPLPASQPSRLYCFGIDLDVPLEVSRSPGRTAFVSAGSFKPASGLAGADSLCQSEAEMHGLPEGQYRALLSTQAQAAAARFDLAGPTWVRVDGIPWLARADDLPTGKILTALNVTADGSYLWYTAVLTGAARPGDRAIGPDDNCADWSPDGQTARAGRAEMSNRLAFDQNRPTCGDQSLQVYCLQQ